MNTRRTLLRLAALAVFTVSLSAAADAQTRTWVASFGDDVNPCSRTAPCRTYSRAHTVTQIGGEVSTVDPNGYGTVTITKSITINGTPGSGYGSILSTGVIAGVTVNITDVADTAKSVRLSWLNINGTGTGTNGIRFLAGNALHVEDTVIDGVTADGISVAGAAGGVVMELYVRDVTIRNCAGDGVQLSNTGAGGLVLASIDRLSVAACGNGVSAQTNSRAHIRNSQFATMNAGGSGVVVTVSTAEANVDSSMITNSPSGVKTSNGTARVSNSVITGNTVGLDRVAGTLETYENNMVRGNTTNISAGVTPVPES